MPHWLQGRGWSGSVGRCPVPAAFTATKAVSDSSWVCCCSGAASTCVSHLAQLQGRPPECARTRTRTGGYRSHMIGVREHGSESRFGWKCSVVRPLSESALRQPCKPLSCTTRDPMHTHVKRWTHDPEPSGPCSRPVDPAGMHALQLAVRPHPSLCLHSHALARGLTLERPHTQTRSPQACAASLAAVHLHQSHTHRGVHNWD